MRGGLVAVAQIFLQAFAQHVANFSPTRRCLCDAIPGLRADLQLKGLLLQLGGIDAGGELRGDAHRFTWSKPGLNLLRVRIRNEE